MKEIKIDVVIAAIASITMLFTGCGAMNIADKGEAAATKAETVADKIEDKIDEADDYINENDLEDIIGDVVEEVTDKVHESVPITESPDKYTWYIKDYVGKNLASFGYTSMMEDRRDSYGASNIILMLMNKDGTFIDPTDEEGLKDYVVTAQSIAPNTEMKLEFTKDSEGNEYDNLVSSQTVDGIVLYVKKVGSKEEDITLNEIKPSADRYTHYVKDYTGLNLGNFGYISMLGDFRDSYGAGNVVLIVNSDDGAYIDVSDKEVLKNYYVKSQNIESNTEFTMEYLKDSDGNEYDNLISSQSIEEIELTVAAVQ